MVTVRSTHSRNFDSTGLVLHLGSGGKQQVADAANNKWYERKVRTSDIEVRVALPSGAKEDGLSEEDQQAIAAAATQAAQEQVEGEAKG